MKRSQKTTTKLALLIIDMLNTLDFPDGPKLLKNAQPAARAILRLKKRLKKKGVPIIYVNDNFGQWRSSWQDVHKICVSPHSLGRPLAELLKPDRDDYFVLKPKHSGFYSTTLDILLGELKIDHLILTGIAGNICVLFTANDAHMREYKVTVPEDCLASNSARDNRYALNQLRDVFKMRTPNSRSIRL